MIKSVKEGMRVRCVGYQFITGVPAGECGTVARSSFGTLYSDPLKRLVNVEWDSIGRRGVTRAELEHVLGRVPHAT